MATTKTPGTAAKAAPPLLDACIGLGLAVLVVAASGADIGPPRGIEPRPIDAGALALAVLVAAAVALRRRYPVPVLVVLNAVALTWSAAHYPGLLILLAPPVAGYTLAALRGWRWGLAGVLVGALSALASLHLAFGGAEPVGIIGSTVWMTATVGAAGTAVGYYRGMLAASRAQLAREAQTREEQSRRRVAEERLRIARELHDILGHTMATISVQAGVGIHLLATRPAQAAEALSAIKQISDEGLTDVKVLLGVLRSDDGEPDRPRAPRGGLDQLEALLDPVRAAGVRPELTVHGDARPLSAAVDLAAYRIIQEALTNVIRHGRARTVRLDLRYEPTRLVIEIRDDGTATGAIGRDGHGITGMRERALALSGRFTADRHPGGGFEVRCELPTAEES
ncbi:two-component sensor histidine kinase [Actinorhabdospora filicis]|uniref:histidine kinase n=1 Tax=Actinorhabdospora filicis TaxID=1785913 RepID=A0A9W6WBD1_9ACTN|nr:sensor histidine kinase [Actinorhabdospora filicis]GLZ79446.1 two-component sensor histidine kinase [Actinorhabdospora filicis]